MARGITIKWDDEAFRDVVGDDSGVNSMIDAYVKSRTSRANANAAGWVSRGFYKNGELIDGKKQAEYGGNVKRMGRHNTPIGIVFTANNSAYNENLEHNTLSKVM